MPISLENPADGGSPFEHGESELFARFIVEMIELENVIGELVVVFFAREDRREEFRRFVLRQTSVSKLLDYLKPYFATRPDGDHLRAEVKSLFTVRNALAHRKPNLGYEFTEDDNDDIDLFSSYQLHDRVLRLDKLGADIDRAKTARGSLQESSSSSFNDPVHVVKTAPTTQDDET